MKKIFVTIIMLVCSAVFNYAYSQSLSDAWEKEWEEVVRKWERKLYICIGKEYGLKSININKEINRQLKEIGTLLIKGEYKGAVDLCIVLDRTLFRDPHCRVIELKNYEFRTWFTNYITTCLLNAGFYQNALYYATEAEEQSRKLKSYKTKTKEKYVNYLYCISLQNLAIAYYNVSDIKKSHECARTCIEQSKGVAGWEDLYYGAMNIEACNYNYDGFYEKALEIEKEVILSDPNNDLYKENYISFLINNGKKEEAIIRIEDMLNNKKQRGENTSLQYADLLNRLSIIYENSNLDKSIALVQEAMGIYKQQGKTLHPNYAQFLTNYASYLLGKNLYQDALDIESRAYNTWSRIVEENNSGRLTSLLRLSLYQYYTNRWNEAESNIIHGTVVDDRNIIYSLCANSKTRSNLWEKCKGWYTISIPKFAYHIKTDSLNMTAYNAALLSKGLLLNTERTLHEINNNNPQVLQCYNEWQNLKNQLSTSQSFEQYQSLENKIANAESEYFKSVETSEDFHKRLYVRWNDVKSRLGVKDIAIEFFSFKDDDEITKYFALVLKKDFASPALVPLFNETELPSTSNAYIGHELGNIVWKPIEKYLEGVENIYFSPSGQLHIYAIENAKHWNEETYMCDKYNIYRLSSTRELVLDNATIPIKKALVFGGIKYKGVPLETYIAESRNNPVQKETNYSDLALNDSKSRGGDGELPYSKIEVAKIHSILTNNGVSSTLKDSIHATENAFKALAVKDVDVIHLSTHGEYLVDTVAKTLSALEMYNFLSPDVNNNQEDEERATLSRSYLKLAGANEKYSKKLPEDVNDGKLTAYEISMLNLDRVNLAVLAACQSGLGDIRGDEVFGLQRGFKKAGVKSILMSLCQIDDEETTYFMTKFYEYMISENKMSKALSFKKAKEATRSKYKDKGSDTWANFILIDAIN